MNSLYLLWRYLQTSVKSQLQYPASTIMLNISQFFLNGGTSASVIRVAAGTEAGLIAALDLLPVICLLSIPAPQTLKVVEAAQAWCETHRAFYLIDLPETPASGRGRTAPSGGPGSADWLRPSPSR